MLFLRYWQLRRRYTESVANSSQVDVGEKLASSVKFLRRVNDVRRIPPFWQMTHAAEASIFSNKNHHPFIGRMSTAVVRTQAHALIDVVQGVIRHPSVKLLSCDDTYCADCALQVQQRAQQLDISIVQDIVLPYPSFENDARGRCSCVDMLVFCHAPIL